MNEESHAQEKLEFEYAWNWFQYHAAQRLTAFNFFLVLVGFLLVGYAQAVDHRWDGIGIAIGTLGALVGFGFWALDVRCEELVRCGSSALLTLEERLGVEIAKVDEDRGQLAKALDRSPMGTGIYSKLIGSGKRRRNLLKHRTWLRLITSTVGLAFAVGAVWAATGFSGVAEDPPARPEPHAFVACQKQAPVWCGSSTAPSAR
jgi:hypothetical protein